MVGGTVCFRGQSRHYQGSTEVWTIERASLSFWAWGSSPTSALSQVEHNANYRIITAGEMLHGEKAPAAKPDDDLGPWDPRGRRESACSSWSHFHTCILVHTCSSFVTQ